MLEMFSLFPCVLLPNPFPYLELTTRLYRIFNSYELVHLVCPRVLTIQPSSRVRMAVLPWHVSRATSLCLLPALATQPPSPL